MSGAPIDRLDARAADDAAADGADFDAAALDSWADKIKELYTADAEQPYALALQEVIVAFFATTVYQRLYRRASLATRGSDSTRSGARRSLLC